jgi:hypothetical protein
VVTLPRAELAGTEGGLFVPCNSVILVFAYPYYLPTHHMIFLYEEEGQHLLYYFPLELARKICPR